MDRSWRSRLGILLIVLLQVLSPSVATWSDARLVAESNATLMTGHVEDHSTTTCPRTHLSDCALCQHIATVGRLTARVALVDIPRLVAASAGLRGTAHPTDREFAASFPRAPPLT